MSTTAPDAPADSTATSFPHLFSPLTVGTLRLRNRVMLPPHGSAIGNLWGTQEEADRNVAYWATRARAGAAWIDGITGHVANRYVPGFEPTGVGAATTGFYRLPHFVDRARQFADAVHAEGAVATAQLVIQGGMPHGPSATLSAPVINLVPHVMTREEIAWYVQEYRFSAGRAAEAGLDGLELHLNHDDLLEWFVSPLTNERDDEYGGSLENRARFAVEVLRGMRDAVGGGLTVGVRMNLREEVPGGYDEDGGIEIARLLEATGLVDYLHVVVGSPWGDPSYIQPQFYEAAQWADLAGRLRAAVSLPVVHTGRITSPQVAERVLASGSADVVGMARAHIADGELLAKTREGRTDEIRPCVGGNECISRRYVEGLPFGCAVNPHASREVEGALPRTATSRRVLVVGGGPAGMELAALSRERGHEVELWEAGEVLGGQLRTAALAPRYEQYTRYLDWQERRLARIGVTVRRGTRGDAAAVTAAGADVVAVATGALPRRPRVPGAAAAHVVDVRDVLHERAPVGPRVLVVAQDDHLPPLSVADFLAERGHAVTVVYATAGPAPLLGRYIVGGILGRLDRGGVELRFMEQVTEVTADGARVRNVYSGRERDLTGFDTVVLACGGVSDDALATELQGRVPEVHVLGDAYAPRRLVFATRQAYALAALL
jgi:2,4-dienoyl-CoA reductase-like NADH-dependent reductase (Old Yellow Enzyme family)/thioredoxin reductase